MRWQPGTIRELIPTDDEDDAADDYAFPALHWMTAGVFLAAGAEAAFGRRRGNAPDEVRWAPLLVAPLAGIAHVARALAPNRATRTAAQLLNGIAIGVGAVGVASSAWSVLEEGDRDWSWLGPRRKPLAQRIPSLAPLAFGAAGMLGVLLDREERADAEEHESLERRARIVERIVPARRPRVQRIVVHV